MAVVVTGVRIPGFARTHEAITHFQWVDAATGRGAIYDKAQMVAWVERGQQAYVASPFGKVRVHVVNASPKYLRTVADGKWANNLVNLPPC